MSDPHVSPTPRRSSSFTVDHRDRAAVLSVEGELDLASAPRLKRALTELLRSDTEQLVLDCSELKFMDSTALSVLIGVDRRLAPVQRMAIAGAHPEVQRVFELSGLAATFRIFPTLDAALAYVANAGGAENHPLIPPLTGDAALMLGIVSTAMPFAQSEEDQVERWLRALRRHGEAGVVLASLGVSEARVRELESEPATERSRASDPDPVAAVTEYAGRIASQRRAARIATTDFLLAAMHAYGAMFDRALAAHGADIDEVVARVTTSHPAAA